MGLIRRRGCLPVTAVIAVALALFLAWFVRDIPSVDDHGLSAEPVAVPADDNAYTVLADASNHWVQSSEWVRDWVLTGTNWDEAGAVSLVASNAALFEQLHRASTMTAYQSRVIRFSDDLLMPWIVPFSDYAKLLKVRSEWQAGQGNLPAAAESAVDLVRIGRLIVAGSGTLLEYMIGVSMEAKGWDQVLAVGRRMDKPEDLKILFGRLPPYAGAAGFETSIRGEWRLAASTIDELAGGDFAKLKMTFAHVLDDIPELFEQYLSGDFRTAPLEWLPRPVRQAVVRLFLHPNRTKQGFADFWRELAEGRERPLKEAFGPMVAAYDAHSRSYERDGWPYLLRRNSAGLALVLGDSFVSIQNLRERASFLECKAAGTRLILALRAYELEHRALPPDLERLVPDDLPAMPRDPYDGSPFRFLPERQAVYAVKADLVDDGGDNDADMVFRLRRQDHDDTP